jgi:hypothetical protein
VVDHYNVTGNTVTFTLYDTGTRFTGDVARIVLWAEDGTKNTEYLFIQ